MMGVVIKPRNNLIGIFALLIVAVVLAVVGKVFIGVMVFTTGVIIGYLWNRWLLYRFLKDLHGE
jgi:hypothetical protein